MDKHGPAKSELASFYVQIMHGFWYCRLAVTHHAQFSHTRSALDTLIVKLHYPENAKRQALVSLLSSIWKGLPDNAMQTMGKQHEKPANLG